MLVSSMAEVALSKDKNGSVEEPKKWFVFQNLTGYYQHNNLIGNEVAQAGLREPKTPKFADIKKGDFIVFYTPGSHFIVGLFKVASEMEYLPIDAYWSPSMVYKIKSYKKPHVGKFIDFGKIIEDNEEKDAFQEFHPSTELWDFVDQEKICMDLSEKEYSLIENAFDDSEYFTNEHVNIDVLVGLLDYYNSRATSFANLVIAVIFGTVTLAAIIQLIANGFEASSYEQIPLLVIGLLYGVFVWAGYYTFKTYTFYAGKADKLKTLGLEEPYVEDLSKLTYPDQKGNKYSNVPESFREIDNKQSHSAFKEFLQKSYYFETAYFGSLLTLAVIVYWSAIFRLEVYLGCLYFSILVVIMATFVIGASAIYVKKKKHENKN
jgi:hypothetical protein